MYPLNIILVGCEAGASSDSSLRSQLRRELSNLLACIKGEYPDPATAAEHIQLGPDEYALFLIYLKTPDDVEKLRRLSAAFPRQPILALRDSTMRI